MSKDSHRHPAAGRALGRSLALVSGFMVAAGGVIWAAPAYAACFRYDKPCITKVWMPYPSSLEFTWEAVPHSTFYQVRYHNTADPGLLGSGIIPEDQSVTYDTSWVIQGDELNRFPPGSTWVLKVQSCTAEGILGPDGPTDCTPFDEATFTVPSAAPPPPPDVRCPPNSMTATVPAGQQCTPKPDVQCPPGSKDATVPFGFNCIPPPVDQVKMQITINHGAATVDIDNLSYMAGSCAFDATPTSGMLPPVHRDVKIASHSPAKIVNLLAPPPLSSFHVVLSCKGDFWGRQIEFGHQEQDLSG